MLKTQKSLNTNLKNSSEEYHDATGLIQRENSIILDQHQNASLIEKIDEPSPGKCTHSSPGSAQYGHSPKSPESPSSPSHPAVMPQEDNHRLGGDAQEIPE